MKTIATITKIKLKITVCRRFKRQRPAPVTKVKKQRVFKGFAKALGANK